MRADGVEPTAVTYNTLLKSCVAGMTPRDKNGKVVNVNNNNNNGVKANFNDNDTLEAEVRSAEGDEVTEVTSSSSNSGGPVLDSGGPALHSGLARARRVLEAMRAEGVSTTVVTYNTLIDACVSAGEPTEAMFGVLSALVAAGHRPDVVTYTTLLKHFSREGDVVAARWLMREMEADGGGLYKYESS
jgi:pentatricopeptide repeat protein